MEDMQDRHDRASARPASRCTKILLAAGVRDIVGCDRKGVVSTRAPDLIASQAVVSPSTPTRAASRGSRTRRSRGADVFIGVSVPGACRARPSRTMAKDAIVFAMANPTPRSMPEEIDGP